MIQKMPEVVECANCQRRLDPTVYSVRMNDNVPEDKITRNIQPTYPYFTILCPCGHFTIFTPYEKH